MLLSDNLDILAPLKELQLEELNYVLLRHPKTFEIDGDIDILVENLKEADCVLRELGYTLFTAASHSVKYLRFDISREKWTHLDVHESLKFGGSIMPKDYSKVLLDSRELRDGIFILPQFHEGIITLLHLALNKFAIDECYVQRILAIDIIRCGELASHYTFIPCNLKDFVVDAQNLLRSEDLSFEQLCIYVSTSLKIEKSNRNLTLNRIFSRIYTLFRIPRGVVILGPDGAGKSTIISCFQSLLWPNTRTQYMGPCDKNSMNPVLYKLLIIIGNQRDRYKKRSVIGIVARILWIITCYIDYWVRFLANIWFVGSKGFIIYDRYPLDMYIRTPTWLNENIFMKFFPKPKVVFLCVGDVMKIYERKLELKSPKEVADVIELYKEKLGRYNIPFIEVDTTENNLEDCVKLILNNLAENRFYLN